MPKTIDELPIEQSKVKFRVLGEKILREGKFENGEFHACSSFLGAKIPDVDYWRSIE